MPKSAVQASDVVPERCSASDEADIPVGQAWMALGSFMLFYLLYGSLYIYKTSFVAGGRRYFCLFDDAMISMRYAANWAHGQGMVWNPGEKVEGYSNFLWTFIMGLLHLLGLEPRITSLPVQVIALLIGIVSIGGVFWLGRGLKLSRAVCLGGALMTALFYPLMMWTLQGMETGLLTCLLIWAAAVCTRSWRVERTSVIGAILGAAAFCTRADTILPLGSLLVVLAWRSHFRIRPVLQTGLIALLLGTGYWVWRWQEYGSFWPNTFYLKMGIPFTFRAGVLGLKYTVGTLDRFGLLFLAVVVLTPAVMGKVARWELGIAFVSCVLYSVWVGGDVWPYDRFICPGVPFIALFISHGLSGVIRSLTTDTTPPTLRHRPLALPACMLIVAISTNFAYLEEWITVQPVFQQANFGNVVRALAIRKSMPAETRVAAFWAGALPYFTGYYSIDMLGKCDPYIAREVSPTLDAKMPPGHNKFDFRYSLHRKHADVLDGPGGMIWPDLTQEAWFEREFEPRMHQVDETSVLLWVRRDSAP